MLSPIDGYIVSKDGEIIDSDDGLYLMDKQGNVYEYSFALDMALKIEADAYAYLGMPYVYDENEAVYFYVEI